MKRLVILCFLTLSATGDREHSPPSVNGDSLNKLLSDPSLSDLLNDPDLWLILKKRIGAPMECLADSRRNNSIIKTQDSLDAGATFIAAPTVQNDKECEKECCKEKSCNTAVLKIKGGRSDDLACYLFDCKSPNRCVFTSHPGFTVLDFSYTRDSDQHAHDLDQLAMTSASTLSSTTSTTTTTTTAATTTVAKVVRPQGSKSVDLFSECHQTSDCRDQNTDCLAGYCVCQQGYHVVEMQCRRDCNQELEFECSNKGSPLFSECIAVYDYCDGIAQCSDGSDESSCLENSKHKEPDMSQGKLQSELTELSSAQDRGRIADPDQSASLASNIRPEVLQDAGPAAEDSTGTRRQPLDTGTQHRLISDETLKENYQNNRAHAASAVDGINGQNYRQPTVDQGQMDGPPLKSKPNQGMLLTQSHHPDLKEKTYQDKNNLQDSIGHRPSETGSSYTDQLLAYSTMSGGGKKFRNELDHGKYRSKGVQKEDSPDRDVSASGLQGTSDTRNMLPASDGSHLSGASGANRVVAGGETKDRPSLSNGLESAQFPIGRGRMDADSNVWSSSNKQREDGIPADKDAAEKSQPSYRPDSDYRHQNHPKVNEDGGGQPPNDQRISQPGGRLMKQNEDSGLPVHEHYGLSYVSGEGPRFNGGEIRQEASDEGYHRTADQSDLQYSDVDIEKAKDAGSKLPAVVKDEQEARRYRPLDAVGGGSRHRLTGMSVDDPRNHKPLMGLTSKDSPDIVKEEHEGYYDAGGHRVQDVLPERSEYDKSGSKLVNVVPEHDGYERQRPKSVNVLPEHIAYDRQGGASVNTSQVHGRYEGPESKSVDVIAEHNNYERQGLKVAEVLPQRNRYDRPGSKSVDAVPERSDYERHGSKSVDVMPEQSGYRRPGLKSSDVLPERVLYERPASKVVNVVPEHGRFDRPASKLLHPGGKDGMFHGKDHYAGGSSLYGTYDNGNYEDEVGNPNYGMWLKADDQPNEPGYVDPRQAMSDSADGYDRDGYLASRLQPEGMADVYGPDYVQYYYNNNNPGFMKSGRNYLHNGDYDDAADPDIRTNGDRQAVQNKGPPLTASPVPETQPSVPNIPMKSPNPASTTATEAPLPPVKTSLASSDPAKSSLAAAGLSSTHHDLLSVQTKQDSQAPDAEVKEEKMERFFLRMESNRGAVVALILGIILTTTLLILAGCRLRHFRKRYRKGRHLNSNEADYLINGMYL